MSKKNHQKVGGKLIQTDKKYSHLKLKQKEKIYARMFEKIKHYTSIKVKLRRRLRRNADAEGKVHSQHPSQRVNFMNMCMISDGQGNVVALEKISGSYQGTTFPGGHVERNETFTESVIREVREETGLKIENPKFCGIYHWYIDNVHQIVYIYLAESYKGQLCSSKEGQVCWIPEKDFLLKNLAPGMEAVLRLIHDDKLSECYLWNEDGCWKEQFS